MPVSSSLSVGMAGRAGQRSLGGQYTPAVQLPDDIVLHLAAREATASPVLDFLSADERARLGGFGSPKRRREFALGRDLARSALADHFAVAPAAVALRVAADGAPEADGLHLSIAHASTAAHTLAVAAVAARPVGVDLEVIRPRRPDLYRFILHPDEVGVLGALPHEHDAAQVLLWTLKEAVLKAMRTGFRVSPKELRFAEPPAEGSAVLRRGEETWDLQWAERDGCFLAVAF